MLLILDCVIPGMAVRGMRGMMGDIALSVSSSLGSRRWGKRGVSSPTLLSGDDAGMILSGASSSSLSILLKKSFYSHSTTRNACILVNKNLKNIVPLYLMSSFWLCGGVGRAAKMSTLFTSSVTESVGRSIVSLEPKYCTYNSK